MRPSSIRRLPVAVGLLSWTASTHAAAPWPVSFSSNTTVGPDGPWNVITFTIDFPDQTQWFMPSLMETSVIVNASVCQSQDADCQQPLPGMWSGSGAQSLREDQNSAQFEPSTWRDEAGAYTTDVMGLDGELRYISDRFTLRNEKTGAYEFLSLVVTAVADNVSVTYPHGASYTLDVGYLSLYGGENTFNWTAANGSAVSQNLTLPNAYNQNVIPSISYGLHIGSAAKNVSGSLFWGGYDQSRVLSSPITATNNSFFSLESISLDVASGASAYSNSTDTPITNLLESNTTTTPPLTARADPGIPYLYLPGPTCDNIAAHLPVTYLPSYGLYLWDTTDPAYTSLLTSPHALTFTFSTASTASTSSISIPLALLNLTLDTIVTNNDPTPYFPCRPYTPTAASTAAQPAVLLGRAFLQGAFLAQNWQSGSAWLAQAPGPSFAAESAKSIDVADTALAALRSPPSWEQTWAGVLRPLETSGGGAGAGAAGAEEQEGFSAGAKAGVGVGAAVAGLALIVVVGGALWWRRKRRAAAARQGGQMWAVSGELQGREVAELSADAQKKEPGELENNYVMEMDSGWRPAVEKPV